MLSAALFVVLTHTRARLLNDVGHRSVDEMTERWRPIVLRPTRINVIQREAAACNLEILVLGGREYKGIAMSAFSVVLLTTCRCPGTVRNFAQPRGNS